MTPLIMKQRSVGSSKLHDYARFALHEAVICVRRVSVRCRVVGAHIGRVSGAGRMMYRPIVGSFASEIVPPFMYPPSIIATWSNLNLASNGSPTPSGSCGLPGRRVYRMMTRNVAEAAS